jgi:hypothetical protein
MSTEYIESFLDSDSPIMQKIAKSLLENNARKEHYNRNTISVTGTYYSNNDRNVSASSNIKLEHKITCINGIW